MKCKHCGSDQMDTQPVNSDAYRCRKCGEYTSGLEAYRQQQRERQPDKPEGGA